MLELLKKVLKPVAPSGLEEPVAAVIRGEVAPYVDSIETDALGNLICVKNGTEANPEKIMLSAHMDHIGYIVTGIEKEGFLRVTNVGGISPTMSLTRHVSFPNGVQGVVVSEVSKDTAMKDLFVDIGAQDKAAGFDPTIKPGNGWDLWKKIAAQDPSFGHPEKFCSQPELSNWESATITTLDDKIPQYIKKICKRDPFSGHTVTGGIVTVKDSSWLLSWTLNRQQQFRDQPKNQLCVWVYGLFSDKPGDYVKKPMRDCTGREICMEWLYHIGVPEEDIAELAEHSANTVPVMMPYIDAFFMPRAFGDRPDIVPQGAVNFAFLGQFAETGRDTIFTTEYSMRTGMEAVYTLLNIDRGVPEVWGSTYDVRSLIDATVKLRDGKKITDMDLPFIQRVALKEVLKKIEGTDLEKFLKEYHAI